MKRLIVPIAVVLGVVVSTSFWLAPGKGEVPEGVRRFMRPKLDHAQKVLEGLALEDYKMIAKNAKSLMVLSEAAEWQVLPSPDYVRYSSEFQSITNELIRSANKGNIESATLDYVQLTMNCVNCHQHVREYRKDDDAKK